MSKQLPDLWSQCYDGTAQKTMPPNDFKETFCNNCINAGCRNSRGAGMRWVQRMLSQEDDLLSNPKFADLQDPQYRLISETDWTQVLDEAIALHVSAKKGDWTVPTKAEIGVEASKMAGILPPAGFQKAVPEPEEEPEPETPTADEVQEYDLHPEGPVVSGELKKNPTVKGQWIVPGSTKGSSYTVTQKADESWSCTCPSRESPCKHIREIALKLIRLPADEPPAPLPTPTFRQPVQVKQNNTNTPSQGIMIGGGSPEPEEVDPWAPPSEPAAKEMEPGGRVRFKRGNSK